MNIIYQYFNEIVLTFADYIVDYKSGVIIIEVPDDKKSFDVVCEKINNQLHRIAETLDTRDQDILVRVVKSPEQTKELLLEKE